MTSEYQAIQAPLNHTYGSYQEAYSALKEHGLHNGYGFRLKNSRPYGSASRTWYYYQCDKAGTYKSQATVKKTATRATGCQFRVIILQKDQQWKLEVKDSEHNHPPSLNPSAHNVYRKRTQSQKETIQAMSQAGIAPKQILTAIRHEDPDTFIAATDIRNDRKVLRSNFLGDRTPVEALIDELSESSDWIFDVKKDSTNHVQYLFFTHRKQLQLLLANPDILLMDCTYRTNKYRLPLLHILGCTNLQTFFSAGFCFLRNETKQDYFWAVSTFMKKTNVPAPHVFISDQDEALKSAVKELLPTVPQLLCVWHINKNVQTKAQHVWRDADATNKFEKTVISEKRAKFLAEWNQVSLTPLLYKTCANM